MNYLYAFLGGLAVGGGVMYILYAKLKASIGAVETIAANVKKAL